MLTLLSHVRLAHCHCVLAVGAACHCAICCCVHSPLALRRPGSRRRQAPSAAAAAAHPPARSHRDRPGAAQGTVETVAEPWRGHLVAGRQGRGSGVCMRAMGGYQRKKFVLRE